MSLYIIGGGKIFLRIFYEKRLKATIIFEEYVVNNMEG